MFSIQLLGQIAILSVQNMHSSSVMAWQKTWAQGLPQNNLGKEAFNMSLGKASGRLWIGQGGMEDRTVLLVLEFGVSGRENECGYV